MNNRYFPVLFFVCFAAALLFDSTDTTFAAVFDKEIQAENLYGQGVHTFFNGEYDAAADLFKETEKLGSQDPRVYFFLALSYHRLQKNDLAETNFKKAAQLEWEVQKFRDYGVSDALRRIQGKERIYLEKFREQAKEDWQNQAAKRENILYGKEQAKDDAVLKAIADSFVGQAPFGAKSLHPFRTEEDVKEKSLIPANDLIPQASAKPVFTTPAKPAQEENSVPAKEMLKEKEAVKEETSKEEQKPVAEDKKEVNKEEKTAEEKEDMKEEKKEEKKEEPKKDSKDEDPFA